MCCCLLGDPSEKINVQRKQKDGNIKEVPSPIIGQMYNKFNYAVRGHCHPGFTAQREENNWHQPIRSSCCLLLTNQIRLLSMFKYQPIICTHFPNQWAYLPVKRHFKKKFEGENPRNLFQHFRKLKFNTISPSQLACVVYM